MHKEDAMLTFQKTADSNFAAEECSTENGFCRIAFTPSPHNGIAKSWFHWIVRNESIETLPPQTRIILKNLQGMLGAEEGRFQPVVRTDLSDWERLPGGVRRVIERAHAIQLDGAPGVHKFSQHFAEISQHRVAVAGTECRQVGKSVRHFLRRNGFPDGDALRVPFAVDFLLHLAIVSHICFILCLARPGEPFI